MDLGLLDTVRPLNRVRVAQQPGEREAAAALPENPADSDDELVSAIDGVPSSRRSTSRFEP